MNLPSPDSPATYQPIIIFDGEKYHEDEIMTYEGREIPYHETYLFDGSSLDEIQQRYTRVQAHLQKALERDIVEFESIDRTPFEKELSKSAKWPFSHWLALDWPKTMKFSEYLAILMQGDKPEDITYEVLEQRAKDFKKKCFIEAGFTVDPISED